MDTNIAMVRVSALTVVFAGFIATSPAQLALIHDINQTEIDAEDPEHFVQNGSITFFTMDDPERGRELWKTDGTAAGTVLVKDVAPGNDDGIHIGDKGEPMVVVGGVLYFFGNDGVHGVDLWRSDGTEAGTQIVQDLDLVGSGFDEPDYLYASGGYVYFAAKEVGGSYLLRSSDGSTITTCSISGGDDLGGPESAGGAVYAEFSGDLYVSAKTPTHGIELFTLNGATATLFADIVPGMNESWPRDLVVTGGDLYFVADDNVNGRELWYTDGTTTQMVVDLTTGASSSFLELFPVNDPALCYFTRFDPVLVERELWRSDGTAVGTVMVKDIHPSGSSFPDDACYWNGKVYFNANDGTHGRELWVSDGTDAGTVMVKDIAPGMTNGVDSRPVVFNSALYFKANDGTSGQELWTSDGTDAGTVLVADLEPGSGSGQPNELHPTATTLFLAGNTTAEGKEIWTSDGTTAGTSEVLEMTGTTGSSDPFGFVELNASTVVFFANDGVRGIEPWVTDPSTGTSMLLHDIMPGSGSSYLYNKGGEVIYNDEVYFIAQNGTNGEELWKTDGTPGGTMLVLDVDPGAGNGARRILGASANGLLFVGDDGSGNGTELWISDGTTMNTTLLLELFPGPDDGIELGFGFNNPSLGNVAGHVYFKGTDALAGEEPWVSDGTVAGTIMLADINPTGSSNAQYKGSAAQETFFSANDGSSTGMWSSDGTTTALVIYMVGYANVHNVVGNDRYVYFLTTGTVGNKIVQHDKQIPGSADDYLDPSDGTVIALMSFGDHFVATTYTVAQGEELAIIPPGTSTTTVEDLYPGPTDSEPRSFIGRGNFVYFIATDASGASLMRLDPTATGTVSTVPGSALALPEDQLFGTDKGLIMRAFDGSVGSEPYFLPIPASISLKAILQGPYDAGTGLMKDDLRSGGLIPSIEPYTALGYTHVGGGGETLDPAVLAVMGDDAVVDWLVMELRHKDDPTQVLLTKSLLVQADGDAMDVNGSLEIPLDIGLGEYYVAVRHRNHLGIMSAELDSLSEATTHVDLVSITTPLYGIESTEEENGIRVMWAGDVTGNQELQYSGLDNDRDPILVHIGGSVPSNIVSGYHVTDVNMDGQTQYTGLGNDRDIILQNIGGSVPTNIRHGQLP